MQQRTNQGGSVVTFVIVGVVLVALVAGGVYFVNQRNGDEVAQQPAGESSQTEQPAGSTQESSAPAQTSNGGTSTQGSGGGSSSQPPTTGVNQSSTQSQNGNLPTTGPVDDSLRLLAFAILIGVATAYVRSQARKQAASL